MAGPQIRTIIRSRTRTRRRFACHRHPNEPITGFCALCLRDRLSGLDSSTDQLEPEAEAERENIIAFPLSRRTRGYGGASSSSAAVPELRRSRSVAVEKCEDLNGSSLDLRRKSCDVRASNRLTDLFDIDDTKSGGDGVLRVESKNLGFSRLTEPVLEITEDDDDDCGEIRIPDDSLVRNVRNEIEDHDEIGEEEDLRTMKEHIEMELQNKKKNLNFWEAASVFSQKLRKWRQKHKEKDKKRSEVSNGGADNDRSTFVQFKEPQIQSRAVDYALGRRSCDTEPRFSIDPHRMSVEDPRFSLDEHRASWDGYMIARTIPRLTPMLPIVDDLIMPPVHKGITVDNHQVQRIKEEGSTSGASAQSNSDSYSSNTGSSSSSMKSSSSKIAGLESVSNARVSQANDVIGQETKLVITERELKDWHLRSINKRSVESASNAPISTCTTVKNSNNRWRKVSNLWNYKHKPGDKKNGEYIQENGASVNENNEINGVERGHSGPKLVRNSSTVVSRTKTESHPISLEGGRHSMSDIDNGLLKLYLPPLRKSRKSKF